MVRDFANFLISKGCKVVTLDNELKVIMKSGLLSSISFKLFFGFTESGNLRITLYYTDGKYNIIFTPECCFTITDSVVTYLCGRNIGLSFNENLYAIIRFLLRIDSTLLSQVGYLTELRDNSLAHLDELSVHIVNNYPNINDYGKRLGYRIKFITLNGFRELYYDVGVDLAKDSFDKFIVHDKRYIVLIECINGIYRNRNDRGNIKEIKDIKSLSKMLKVML